MYISWWVYFVTGLSLVLQQPATAVLAKTKADIAKKELLFLLVSLVQCMCLCPNGPQICFSQFGQADNRRQELTVLIYMLSEADTVFWQEKRNKTWFSDVNSILNTFQNKLGWYGIFECLSCFIKNYLWADDSLDIKDHNLMPTFHCQDALFAWQKTGMWIIKSIWS